MAIASGKVTVENDSVKKLFTGIAPMMIIAVNPTKAELEEIYGRELEKEPEYLSTTEAGVKRIRFDFIIKSYIDPKNGCNEEFTSKISYFLEDAPNIGKNSGKYEVINKYGESTWLSEDNIKNKTLPDNMSFFCTDGLRVALKGEVDLVNFIKQFVGIPMRQFEDKVIPNIKDAECQLDEIKKYFSGNIKEVVSVINSMKATNKVKLLAGVKTSDDNKQYQSWFTQRPLKYRAYKYDSILKAVKEKQNAGSYPNVDFGPDDMKLREYSLTPTEFSRESAPQPLFGASEDVDSFAMAMDSGVPANNNDWFNQK
jgi:hypothetical protein